MAEALEPCYTHDYIEADMAMKDCALATIAPPETKHKRYLTSDAALKLLGNL